jgi:two-component system, NtrC family, response regulator AlgB
LKPVLHFAVRGTDFPACHNDARLNDANPDFGIEFAYFSSITTICRVNRFALNDAGSDITLKWIFMTNGSLAGLLPSADQLQWMEPESSAVLEPCNIHTRNTRMRRLIDRLRSLSNDAGPLLLRGECGVGKRLMTRLIHRWAGHRSDPHNLLSCGQDTPEQLFRLIGESAEGGMLVLDEIGGLPLEAQALIVRLIDHKEPPLTHNGTILRGNPRIVATTSEDLHSLRKQGRFSEDLLSRLSDVAIHVPPLRERPEDILGLADQFLEVFGRQCHKGGLVTTAEARQALVDYHWPGNVRELRNVIERVVIGKQGTNIGAADLGLRRPRGTAGGGETPFLSLDAMEKQHILEVIQASPTLEDAAKILKVDITTLWRKRRRYGV